MTSEKVIPRMGKSWMAFVVLFTFHIWRKMGVLWVDWIFFCFGRHMLLSEKSNI